MKSLFDSKTGETGSRRLSRYSRATSLKIVNTGFDYVPVELTEEINLISVIASIDGYELRLALDTGASDTVVDLTALLIAGYQIGNVIQKVEIETGKGVIEADVYLIDQMEALGIVQTNFTLCAYDFLANNILADIDGVLGIDFLKDRKICIDFRRFEITIQ